DHERELRPLKLAVDHVQVRTAHTTRANTQEHLTVTGLRIRQLAGLERRVRRPQHHRFHRDRPARSSRLTGMRELLEYRSEVPILEHTTYLINHSLAAMPRQAEERLAEYARMWRERGIRAWGEGWWDMPVTVGDQIGRIVGGPAGSTVMHQNVA